MTEKKRISADNPGNVGSSKRQYRGETASKRARARRLVLKSLATGGAVTTARALPDTWTRPITESVMLPVHAQVSAGALSCRVQSLSLNYDFGDDATAGSPVYSPSGPPFSGGSPAVTVDSFFNNTADAGPLNIALDNVRVTLDPAAPGQVTLHLNGGGDYSINGSNMRSSTINANGVAKFNGINGDLVPNPSDGQSSGNLELRFSIPGASDCVINFSFVESSFYGPT